MKNSLRSNQLCPVHRSYYCCGRARTERLEKKLERGRRPSALKGWIQVGEGLWRIEDQFHPRGYREKRSADQLRRIKNQLLLAGAKCLYCASPWTDYRDVEVAHKEPKGMGGARRDDHPDNLGLAHRACNWKNGSRRFGGGR